MNADEFQREANYLYEEYLKEWQEKGGGLPLKLPGLWRAVYENLTINLVDPEDKILNEIEEFKEYVLSRRREVISYLSDATSLAVPTEPPKRKDGKRVPPAGVIQRARQALDVYRQRDDTRLNVAYSVFGFSDAKDDKRTARAEGKVRQYLYHAEFLIQAAGNGTFLEALTSPLTKNV